MRIMKGVEGGYDTDKRPSPILEEFYALTQYRELIWQLIARSVKTRYKRSVLGVAWTMVNPLLTMIVLTLVFSGLFGFPARTYALHVLSGLLLWNFFAQSTTAAMGDLIWSGGLISRVYLPKSVFAVAAVGTGLVNLVLALIPYSLIALILGSGLPITIILLPLPVIIFSLFTLGIALALSALAVRFADVMPMYEILLTAWMYLTPIIYPLELVPPEVLTFLKLNPVLYHLVGFRSLLLAGELPDIQSVGLALLSSCLVLLLGWWFFTRRAREFANYV